MEREVLDGIWGEGVVIGGVKEAEVEDGGGGADMTEGGVNEVMQWGFILLIWTVVMRPFSHD